MKINAPHITNFVEREIANLNKFVICIHGFSTNKHGSKIARLMMELKEKNIGAVALDMPGHGENKKELTIHNCVDDISQAVKFLQTFNKPISFYGSSFGGYCTLAYLMQTTNTHDKIVLIAPAVDIYKNHGTLLNTEKNGILITQNYLDSIKKFNVQSNTDRLPQLDIIYAENDSEVNNNDIFNLEKIGKAKLYEIKNADHWFDKGDERDQLINHALSIYCGLT